MRQHAACSLLVQEASLAPQEGRIIAGTSFHARWPSLVLQGRTGGGREASSGVPAGSTAHKQQTTASTGTQQCEESAESSGARK